MSADELEDSILIDATADDVWAMVSDVRRMSEWSPQVDSTRLRSGFENVEHGAEFTNRNSQGDVTWTTHAEIVRFEAPREIAFRIAENYVIWSYTVAPEGDGTRLTQRRETPDGISDQSHQWVEEHLGGVEAFNESIEAGTRETLERIKAAAEA